MSTLSFALRARTFRSLRRHRNYRIFFTGQVVSLAGTWMQNVALAWLVIELSGSPLAIGALAFWRFVPFTIFGLVAGVVADRIESRKLVMATQASAMVISIALAVVTLTDTATLPIVYVLAALGGVALAFDAPGPPVADVPDGRAARASERRRAQLGSLQRLAGDRPGDRRRRDRNRRHRSLLRHQRGELPRGADCARDRSPGGATADRARPLDACDRRASPGVRVRVERSAASS